MDLFNPPINEESDAVVSKRKAFLLQY